MPDARTITHPDLQRSGTIPPDSPRIGERAWCIVEPRPEHRPSFRSVRPWCGVVSDLDGPYVRIEVPDEPGPYKEYAGCTVLIHGVGVKRSEAEAMDFLLGVDPTVLIRISPGT